MDYVKKYKLTKDDFWELKQGGKTVTIITHDACEKIAEKEGITFEPPTVVGYTPTIRKENGDIRSEKNRWGKEVGKDKFSKVQVEKGEVMFIVTGKLGEKTEWATGEANANNCTAPYYGAMAEKRGKDRVILKLIGAYNNGWYSDVESNDFSRRNVEQKNIDQESLGNCKSCGKPNALSKKGNVYCSAFCWEKKKEEKTVTSEQPTKQDAKVEDLPF